MYTNVFSFFDYQLYKNKIVVNSQSSEVHNINTGVPQGSLLGPILFLLYINELAKRILRLLVCIYVDDTNVYIWNLEDRDLVTHHSTDLSLVTQ